MVLGLDKSLGLQKLLDQFGVDTNVTHDALSDAICLYNLVGKAKLTNDQIDFLMTGFKPTSHFYRRNYQR
jgi:hypothetical protein